MFANFPFDSQSGDNFSTAWFIVLSDIMKHRIRQYKLWDVQLGVFSCGGGAIRDQQMRKKGTYQAIMSKHEVLHLTKLVPRHALSSVVARSVRSIVENASYKDNWTCDWLSFENIIQFDKSVMKYKIRNQALKVSWTNFNKDPSQSNCATRNISYHFIDLEL